MRATDRRNSRLMIRLICAKGHIWESASSRSREQKVPPDQIFGCAENESLTPPARQLEGGAVSLRQGRWLVTPAGGARAVPAGRGSSPPLPGGFGKTPGRHYDRPAIGSLDWDRRRRSNGRRSQVPGSASGAKWRRWFAATRTAVERR